MTPTQQWAKDYIADVEEVYGKNITVKGMAWVNLYYLAKAILAENEQDNEHTK